MPTQWVDFKELRSKLKMVDILARYRVPLKVRGDRASAFCPLPGHKSSGEGKRRSPSFSCNLSKGIFQCFSCGGKGNCLDLICLLEGGNPDDPASIRKAALKAQEVFGLSSSKTAGKAKLIVDLVKPDGRIWLMPDGNNAGMQCAKSLFERVGPHRFVRWVCLPPEMQPTDYMADELTHLLQQ